MYEGSVSLRIEENHKSAKEIYDLQQDKLKMQEKYDAMVQDINRFIGQNVKKTMRENYKRIMEGASASVAGLIDEGSLEEEALLEVVKLRKVNEDLAKENEELKKSLQVMKEEKKNLEYNLFDLLKASDQNKQKLKDIKAICERVDMNS